MTPESPLRPLTVSSTGSTTLASDLSRTDRVRLFVRIAVFLLLIWVGHLVFASLLQGLGGNLFEGPLVISALSVFATAAFANAVVVRGWEQGRLSDFGLGWTSASGRQVLTGFATGAGAASSIVILALILQLASFISATDANNSPSWAAFPILAVVLLLGAVGEELLFHGYAFQHLVRISGDFAAVLPVGVIFGIAHLGNQNSTALAILNTIAWGVLLGYAYLQTRALWLSIGLHFGWNLAQPLLGANLSGFTMGVTGYKLHWRVGPLWSGGEYGLEGGLFTTAVVIALFVLLPRLQPKQSDAQWELAEVDQESPQSSE